MNNGQIFGVRILFVVLGWIVGYVLFGPEAEWLFGIPAFIWCGAAGGIIGTLIAGEPKK